jgi:hypothetical protein
MPAFSARLGLAAGGLLLAATAFFPSFAETGLQPGPAPSVTVYAAGDIARCAYSDPAYSGAADTARTVAAGLSTDPNAVVLTLGDHTYPHGTAREFADCYGPTWGRFKDRTWPAPGNHEYYTPKAAPYFAYFGERAAHGWYSLDLGGWHVISLDSSLAPAAHVAQMAWLRADLASHPARCTLAFWHEPLYSSGGHGSIPKMRQAWRLLMEAGAELVLSGHDHDYERFAPQDADGRLDRARGMRQSCSRSPTARCATTAAPACCACACWRAATNGNSWSRPDSPRWPCRRRTTAATSATEHLLMGEFA